MTLKNFALSGLAFMLPAIVSCGKDEPDIPDVEETEHTLLVYAVASNNLYSYFRSDSLEMIKAAAEIDLSKVSLLLYKCTPSGYPELLKLAVDDDGEPCFRSLRRYDRETFSTDPVRISEVIGDASRFAPGKINGLVLWSHGTGWAPDFDDHCLPGASYSFGADKVGGYTDHIDIDELSAAIPDCFYDYIWFDACYMSGIEMIYQLRNKCDTFVGYPTEIWSAGNPYHLTLPYIMRAEPLLTDAAKILFDYYNNAQNAVSVAVVDMSVIEEVADVCSDIYLAGQPADGRMQDYARRPHGPFYDFGQYTKLKASGNAEALARFESAMARMIVYKSVSDYDFNNRPVNVSEYSGISCHLYTGPDSKRNIYYSGLDWSKRVYPK